MLSEWLGCEHLQAQGQTRARHRRAQGIGLANSRQLAAAGCDVFVHYRTSREPAEQLCREVAKLGVRAACGAGDLTQAGECERVVNEAAAFLGGLDILINNAGSLVARKPFAENDDAFWAETMTLNLDSCRRGSRAALLPLAKAGAERGGARIVNLSSLAGRMGGGPGALAYATAKGAMLTFTRGLATELGPKGIRVNAVAPGLILGSRFHEVHTPAEAQQKIIAGIPLGRPGYSENVARAVVYLTSEFDGFITGATLDINGRVYYAWRGAVRGILFCSLSCGSINRLHRSRHSLRTTWVARGKALPLNCGAHGTRHCIPFGRTTAPTISRPDAAGVR